MTTVRVFNYIEELDAFVVSEEFARLADRLNLREWHPVVWIGRLFALDNDFGEHWFDNWDERDERSAKAERLGIAYDDLMVVVPDRLRDGRDGPCHPPELRKAFWTDVLKSLRLSNELIFQAARHQNEELKEHLPEDWVPDLDERIAQIQRGSESAAEEPAVLTPIDPSP
jgi:hypothetical protein